ncbi:MAG: PAS domain S-box protein [bacterium]
MTPDTLHPLLHRQLKKHLVDPEALPPELWRLVSAVDNAYSQFDEDRRMLERSLELSSQELVQANAQMRAIFQAFPDHLLLIDSHGTIIDAKNGQDNWLELHPEHLIGRQLADTLLIDYADEILTAAHRARENDQIEMLAYTRQFKGEPVHLEARIIPSKNRNVVLVLRDNTDIKRAEAALRINETRYRTQFENATDAIFIMKDYRFVECNQKTLNMFSCQREDIIGKLPGDISPMYQPDGRASEEKGGELMDLALSGAPQYFEWQHKRLGGSLFAAEVSLKRFEVEGEDYLMAMVRDVTERKAAQQALAAEKERLAVTLGSITEGVFSTDVQGTIMLMNRVAEELCGWSAAEAVGRLISEVLDIRDQRTGERIGNPVDEIILANSAIEVSDNLILTTRDNETKTISKSGSPIIDAADQVLGVVLVIKDITVTKRFEEEIFKAKKLESIGVLAGGIAHDFNNLLMSIMGNIALAKIYQKSGRPVAETLENAERAALRARDLTQQFLTFSKGGAPIKQTASMVKIIEESVRFALRGSNVKCGFEFTDDLWPVDVDRGQINQVINNMIINADQAMPDGGKMTISVQNRVMDDPHTNALPEGNYIEVTIADAGTGIADADLKQIFDPYFTTKEHGSGLGLASSYGIIKKHHGSITVESTLGVGTTFTIMLPASAGEVVEVEEAEVICLGQGKIALMDDDESVLNTVTFQLSELGYTVETALDGNELINLYKQAQQQGEPFDVVILDLTIPGGMGGAQTLEKLREVAPEVKALVSSGYSNNPIMAHYADYGFCGVVAKPFSLKELSEQVQRAIQEGIPA